MQGKQLLAWTLVITATSGCSPEGQEALPTTLAEAGAPTVRAPLAPTAAPRGPGAEASPIPSAAAAADLFPRQVSGRRFFLASDVDLPLSELAELADEAYLRFAERLEVPRDRHPPAPVPVYLASRVEALSAVERRHGFPSSQHSGRSFAFRGGFYPQGPVIALAVENLANARWTLLHEIAHLAFSRAVSRPPDLVNEGLAELFTGWLDRSPHLALEEVTSVHPVHAERCRRAVEEGAIPPLRELFALDYWEFRADRHEFLHYALGWHLVRFLLEDADAAVTGSFDRYLDELRAGRGGWAAFRRVYDAPLVERLWREELARPLAWRPLFGTWYDTNGGFRSAVRGAGSAVLLHAERPRRDAPWEIAYEIDLPEPGLPYAAGVGFVLGHRSPEDFTMLSLILGGREVVLYHHGGAPSEPHFRRLRPHGLSSARLALRIETDGSLLLRIDGEPAARFGPLEGAHDGEAGLLLEWRDEGSAGTELCFRSVRAGDV